MYAVANSVLMFDVDFYLVEKNIYCGYRLNK